MAAPTPRRPPPAFQQKPPAKPQIPIPRTPEELPAKYRPAATKVKLIIVALPIAIVSSYMLYKRLVMGEEPKRFNPKREDFTPKR
ncbi:hypothetical protein H072_3874 [Dactylellina haptotyla CBS 200.50]|uniref:Uncharacterized protein n=1 Tax=Dactylellina haptotyla (strain CBS 200.50) TaxID=1284197 RepID=S8AM02_DACHA|nr:hypothetical protein H072_3874 [Dactylellina haptotyla CBS 200.50]